MVDLRHLFLWRKRMTRNLNNLELFGQLLYLLMKWVDDRSHVLLGQLLYLPTKSFLGSCLTLDNCKLTSRECMQNLYYSLHSNYNLFNFLYAYSFCYVCWQCITRCVTKYMYVEKLKWIVIRDEGSIWLYSYTMRS